MVFTMMLNNERQWAKQTKTPAELKRENTFIFSYLDTVNIDWMDKWWDCKNRSDFSTCTGMIAEIPRFFADNLNMTVELKIATGNQLGRMTNGTWSGATGDVISGRADISVAGWSPTRCAFLTCLDYFTVMIDGLLIPMPKQKSFLKGFVQPFDPAIWICLLVSLLVMALFLFTLKDYVCPKFQWLPFLGSVIGVDVPQQVPTADGTGTKIPSFFPVATWYAGIAFLTISYSALVFGFFADPLEPRIKTLRGLLDSGYKIEISPNVNTLITNLKNSKGTLAKEMVARMKEVRAEESITFFPEVNEAYINDDSVLALRVEAAKRTGTVPHWNKFYMLAQPGFFEMPQGFRTAFLRKDFPKINQVKKLGRYYVEHGFQTRAERFNYGAIKDELKANERMQSEDERGLKSIELRNIYGIFVFWMIGNIAATVIFLGEIVAKMIADSKANKEPWNTHQRHHFGTLR